MAGGRSNIYSRFTDQKETPGRLNNGHAQLAFRGGEIVAAHYQGKEAFFDMLREKKGRFSFSANLSDDEEQSPPIDGFMKLLMEGLRVIDEEAPAVKQLFMSLIFLQRQISFRQKDADMPLLPWGRNEFLYVFQFPSVLS